MLNIFALDSGQFEFDVKNIIELCGVYDCDYLFFILGEHDGILDLYELYLKTKFNKVMYIYCAGDYCIDYLSRYGEKLQIELLEIIDNMYNEVDSFIKNERWRTDRERIHWIYTKCNILYIKHYIVSYMDLSCPVCIKYDAQYPTAEELVNIIKDYIAKYPDTYILYRIMARVMISCDEVSSGLQILDMVCSKYEYKQDLLDKYIINMSYRVYDIESIDKAFCINEETFETQMARAYYAEEIDKDIDGAINSALCALEVLDSNIVGTFDELRNMCTVLMYLKRLHLITNDQTLADKFDEHLSYRISKIRNGDKTDIFIRNAKTCGISKKDLNIMLKSFVDELYKIEKEEEEMRRVKHEEE